MRIALVHKRLGAGGGTEQVLAELASRLLRDGHEVHAICARVVGGPDPRIRVHRVRAGGPEPGWRMLRFAVRADRAIREREFDAVQGFGKTLRQDVLRTDGGCHAAFLEKGYGARPGGPLARLASLLPKHRVALAIERRSFASENTPRIVAISRMARDDLVRLYGVDPGRIEVVANAVDLDRFHPRNRDRVREEVRGELGLADAAPLALFVGSGFARKGIGPLLESFGELRRRGAATRLLIAGSDRRLEGWRARAREAAGDRVQFAGWRGDPERLYAAADLLVFPSRYDPFGLAVLEALASGLPVVTTEGCGAAELVVPGRTGAVLANPPEPRALADAMEEWTDPEKGASARGAARETAERHGLEPWYGRHLAIWREIAASRGVT